MEIKNLVLSEQALEVIDNGVWVDDLEHAPGVKLKVLGLRSEAVQKSLRAKHTAARIKNGGGPLSEDDQTRCMRETMAEVAILDWSGLTSNGKPVAFSRKLAKEYIVPRGGDMFAALVLSACQRVDSEAESFVDQLKKN